MRIRTIKPEFFLHEELYNLERETGTPIRVAFAGLWCAADRAGRFEWRPSRLGVQILPYDCANGLDFARVLDACLTRGFIRKYRVGDAWYGCIPSWLRHQVINNRESASAIPDITKAEEVADACPTRASREADGKSGLQSGREGKGREGNKEGISPSALPPTSGVSGAPAEQPKPQRARDPLFDALARACDRDPLHMTSRDARACGVALAEIRKASPDATPAEIDRRAANYRSRYREAALTPSALCNQWAACATGAGRPANGGFAGEVASVRANGWGTELPLAPAEDGRGA